MAYTEWIEVSALTVPHAEHQALELGGLWWNLGASQDPMFAVSLERSSETAFAWTLQNLPAFLVDHGAAVYRGRAYIFGGLVLNGFAGVQGDAWSSVDGDSWRVEAPMPTPVGLPGVAVWQDNIVAICGFLHDGPTTARIQVFNGDVNDWTDLGELFPITLYGPCVGVIGDWIYVWGGFSDTLGADSRKVFKSNDLATWTEVGSDALPYPVEGAAGGVFDGKLWMVGGYDGGAARAESWYSEDGGLTWIAGPTLPQPLDYGAIAANATQLIHTGGYEPVGGLAIATVYRLETIIPPEPEPEPTPAPIGFDISRIRALARNLNFRVHGIDVTVGATDTRGIWLTPETEDYPGSLELHRRERSFILAVPLFRIAKGTIVLAPAAPAWANLLDPPPSPGEVLRWEVDGVHSIEADHTRIRLVLSPLEET